MNGFYHITEAFNTILQSRGFRVVTLGDDFKVDLERQTIFPYVHIVPLPSTRISDAAMSFTFRVIGMDIVDFNKDDLREADDAFHTTDNMQDVLNDIHNRFANFIEEFDRGDSYTALLQMDGEPVLNPFFQRFKNMLAGWEFEITVKVPNDATIC